MSEGATPPTDYSPPTLEEDAWHALPDPAGTVAALAGALAGLGPAVGLAILASAFLPEATSVRLMVAALLLVSVTVLGALIGRARARRVRWRLDARGLSVRRGLFWHSEILVPRSRVQHLDIERGPLERQFGLATLVVHTAGTRMHALRQAGFADGYAMALRDALVPEARRHDDAL
ncbi:PH domain-containing protein [Arenimonas fontis]|uniref:PH domain-containing protein n=1 Tax=Arenimonas fontis TaxID=2608255 RepID=A0A5B2Z9L1_9GAMM|nr:PH domain-containing protein [Arenimonas fontis]KAA2284627.1 PH domain-containing protein [Arenimonas fontis]